MVKFKFFSKSASLEKWLNKQAEMGNKCIKAFPDFYIFLFEKSTGKTIYQVEGLSFMQNRQRNNYLTHQKNKGKKLLNNSISDGFYVFELPNQENTSDRIENPLSFTPLLFKSFISNILLSICIIFLRDYLQFTGTIYNVMTIFSGSCLFLALYSIAYMFLAMIKYERVVINDEFKA